MSVTPESGKTVSKTPAAAAQGPTPKSEFKKPLNKRDYFMSPTDALVSPCTQKLNSSRRLPRTGYAKPKPVFQPTAPKTRSATSSLADKENEKKAPPKVISSLEQAHVSSQPSL